MTCTVCRFRHTVVVDRCPRCRFTCNSQQPEPAGEGGHVSFDLPALDEDTATTPSVTLLADTRALPQQSSEM